MPIDGRWSYADLTMADKGGIDFYRGIIAIVMLGILFGTLSWLQGRFDSSDHEKATELVKDYRASEGGPTITDAILSRHPTVKEHELSWSSTIISGCRGYVRVHAVVPMKGNDPGRTYEFDVALTEGPSIHPTDPTTVEILKSLTATTSTRSSSMGRR